MWKTGEDKRGRLPLIPASGLSLSPTPHPAINTQKGVGQVSLSLGLYILKQNAHFGGGGWGGYVDGIGFWKRRHVVGLAVWPLQTDA